MSVCARYQYDRTPLHWAAREGKTSVAELLVTKGAVIEARDIVSAARKYCNNVVTPVVGLHS